MFRLHEVVTGCTRVNVALFLHCGEIVDKPRTKRCPISTSKWMHCGKVVEIVVGCGLVENLLTAFDAAMKDDPALLAVLIKGDRFHQAAAW